MKRNKLLKGLILSLGLSSVLNANSIVFEDSFNGKINRKWKILNEKKNEWNLKNNSLNLLVQTENIWDNLATNANNMFTLDVKGNFTAEVDVSLIPENAYEQAGLAIYQNDDNYIKISKEMFNNKLSLVFVSEKDGKPTVLKRIDYTNKKVSLQIERRHEKVITYFKNSNESWEIISATSSHLKNELKVALYTFSGDEKNPKWANFKNFKLKD